MKQTQITKCPKCDTTFRVSPAQLEVAKGAVRCGACLHVFRAGDHFQNSKKPEPNIQDDRTQDMFGNPTAPEQATPVSQEQPQTKADVNEQSDDDFDFLITDNQQETIELPTTMAATKPLPDELESSADYIEDDVDDFLIDDDNGLIDDENGIDEDFIHDESGRKAPIISDLNEDFLSIDVHTDSDPFHTESDKLNDTVESEDRADDESWADALLDDTQETQQSAPAQPQKNLKPAPSKPNFTFIEDDPLDLSLPNKISRKRFWVLSALSALLVVSMVGQMAYFNLDQWARNDQYRPYYAFACEHIGCKLPSSYDLKQIRTTATPQVSSHPKFKNALSVDVLFMNHAAYEQAFPKLELTFTDKNDKVIAHRLFTPREYLAGEASGLTMMPSETPIHIALEIQDPGPQANNYQVRFVAP
ncbi:DUF3426 domain-containing protein [Oceaniserpentilla sp. 4NH20-0058]|uniref:zinc-ribbon and DUF3426 domain-containing protein n=1 Tax=Oceaniserpentilla sp. 4NH20-0058 TaxID=3127660 RepID=UPI00310B6AB6